MSYDTCINCTQEVIDPTNPSEETVFVHLDTFLGPCDPEDLRAQGLKPEEGYHACPIGPGDDAPVLFINQNGRLVCARHGGSYLQSVLRNNPEAREAETPLDHWLRVPAALRTKTDACEEC